MRSAISWALVVGLLGCAPGGEEPGRADINAVETAPERTARAIPVILDTDIGGDIDDTWALIMLLKSPNLDVRLITTDQGDTVYRAKIVARLLEIDDEANIAEGTNIVLHDSSLNNIFGEECPIKFGKVRIGKVEKML